MPPPADDAPPDLSTPAGCIAAFAAVYDRGWPTTLTDAAIAEVKRAVIAAGWGKRVDEFMAVAIGESTAWSFGGVNARHAEAAAAERNKAVRVVPAAEIDATQFLPGPKPARGSVKPGLRGGLGK